MAKVGNWLPSAVLALGVIILFLLLLFGYGIMAYLLYNPSASQIEDGTGNQTTETGAVGKVWTDKNTTTSINMKDIMLWDNITNENVETACLRRAKEEAKSSAAFVYSCVCKEGTTAAAARKTYSCDISTADPFARYFVNIDCFFEERVCTVRSNYGTEIVTFDELRAWYAE